MLYPDTKVNNLSYGLGYNNEIPDIIQDDYDIGGLYIINGYVKIKNTSFILDDISTNNNLKFQTHGSEIVNCNGDYIKDFDSESTLCCIGIRFTGDHELINCLCLIRTYTKRFETIDIYSNCYNRVSFSQNDVYIITNISNKELSEIIPFINMCQMPIKEDEIDKEYALKTALIDRDYKLNLI